MSVFSFILTTRFSSWCRYFGIFSSLIISSSVSGFTFTTTPVGGKNNYHKNRNQDWSRRPRLRYGGQVCQQRQHTTSTTATTLNLSFSTELPVANEIISTYGYCLKYHYFPTQSITNAILTVVGDGVAQTHEEGQRQASSDNNNKPDIKANTNHYYDPKRGLVYFFKGLGSGIMWAWWFDMAEVWSMELTQSVLSFGSSSSFQQSQEVTDFATSTTALTGPNGSTAYDVLSVQAQTIRTAINILMEQFLVCPVLFSLWDVPVTSMMRGSPVRQIPAQIREKLLPLLSANAKVWTLVNVVTYNIPLEYRLLFTSAASIVSESINSGITSKEIVVPETPRPPAALENLPLFPGSVSPIAISVTAIAEVVPLLNSGGISGKNATMWEL